MSSPAHTRARIETVEPLLPPASRQPSPAHTRARIETSSTGTVKAMAKVACSHAGADRNIDAAGIIIGCHMSPAHTRARIETAA